MFRSYLYFFLWPIQLSFIGGLVKGIGKAVSGVAKAATGFASGSSWLGLGGSLLGGIMGREGAQDAMDFSSAQSAEQMAFQERMYKNRYQYQVEDLKKAGLNPMMAYMQAPAAPPQGSQAHHIENKGLASAQGAMLGTQVRYMDAQTKNAETQAMLNTASAAREEATAKATLAQAGLSELELGRLTYLKDIFDSWNKDGFRVQSDKAQSLYDMYKAENDLESLAELNALARKHGYQRYDAAVRDTDFLQSLNNLYQSKLKNAEHESMSGMWRSDYGRNVAPYVNSASSIAGSVSGVGGAVANVLRSRKLKDWSKK